MKKLLQKAILLLVIFQVNRVAAVHGQTNDSASIDKLRTESGVDPTRVQSRIGYTMILQDQKDAASLLTNRVSLTLGVNRWSFGIKYEALSRHTGVPGSGFQSGFGDIRFSILNAFFVKGKHAMAANVEFSMPTGGVKFGTGYATATPAFTYSYTFNPSLFLAIQPQYTFALMKDPLFPDLQVLTIRAFIAKFTKSGLFLVFEPRQVYDLGNDQFDLILAPIIGKSLGGGFNLIGLLEIPTRSSTFDVRGMYYQFGFNKNF